MNIHDFQNPLLQTLLICDLITATFCLAQQIYYRKRGSRRAAPPHDRTPLNFRG